MSDINQEVNQIITTMSLQQLEQRADELNKEQTNLNKDLQNLIDTNLKRFKSLQEPIKQIPQKIEEFSQQLQYSHENLKNLHTTLEQTTKQLSTFKQQARDALQQKQKMIAYEHFRTLADDLRKQPNYDQVFKNFNYVNVVYEYIAEKGLNDSLNKFQQANNEAIWDVIGRVIKDYSVNFEDHYFSSLLDFGISFNDLIRITVDLLNQQIPQLNLRQLIAHFNTLFSQFKTKQIFMNNKCLQNMLQKLDGELNTSKDDMQSYCLLLIQLFKIQNEQHIYTPRFKHITCLLKNQVKSYAHQCCNDQELQLNQDKLIQLLKHKSTEFVLKQMKQKVEDNMKKAVAELTEVLPFNARVSSLFVDIQFSQSDNLKLQNWYKNINDEKELFMLKFLEIQIDEKLIVNSIKEYLLQSAKLLLQESHHQELIRSIYSIIMIQRLVDIDYKNKIISLIVEQFNVKFVTNTRQFVETVEQLCFSILQLINLFQPKDFVNNKNISNRQVVSIQMKNYMKQEGEEKLKSFFDQAHRKDIQILRMYVKDWQGTKQQFDQQQFQQQFAEISNLRRFIYYCIGQALKKVLGDMKEYFTQSFTYEESTKVIVGFFCLVLTTSSVINETEMEALSEAIQMSLSLGRPEKVTIDALDDRFTEMYMV